MNLPLPLADLPILQSPQDRGIYGAISKARSQEFILIASVYSLAKTGVKPYRRAAAMAGSYSKASLRLRAM